MFFVHITYISLFSTTKFMSPVHVKKRDNTIQQFDPTKIEKAISKGMQAAGHSDIADAKVVASLVTKRLDMKVNEDPSFTWTVEEIQDTVEDELMSSEYHDVAKAYILYRAKRKEERKRDIFKKRINIKPYEYPELLQYVDAVRHSYWIHTEYNFTSDVQHFQVGTTPSEKNAIKNCMLAIAQIEVSVKTFRGDIYKKFPKTEIGSVWATFAESEVRHQDAYSHLLDLLGLNEEFEKIKDVPVMMQRINYLEKSLKNSKSEDNKEYAKSLLLFSLFIEHVSLFSQFLIMMSFNKHKNLFKWISNVVEATSKEEQIHGLFGIDLINIIKEENPERFDDAYYETINKRCMEAYEAESNIIDWIFEAWEIDLLPKAVVNEFIKSRFNNSLVSIWGEKLFDIDDALVQQTDRFDDEIVATKHGDFFDKRSINYSKKTKSITSDDLF